VLMSRMWQECRNTDNLACASEALIGSVSS
jgi:hypothetical protein